MSLILLFLLLLVLMFGVLVYLLKPPSMEKAVEEQLASIEEAQPGEAGTSILKERAARSTLVEELAQRLPWSQTGSRPIKQPGPPRSFRSLSPASLPPPLPTSPLPPLFTPHLPLLPRLPRPPPS